MEVQGQVPVAGSSANNQDGAQAAQNLSEQQVQGQDPTFDAEYVKSLRSEAADYRKKLRDLEAKVKSEEDAKMSESEKLQKRLNDLEQQATAWEQKRKAYVTEYEIRMAAGRLGIVDPDAAFRLLDLSTLEYDDDGKPTNVDTALKALTAKRQYLLGASSSSVANPHAQHGGKLTLDDVKKMSHDEINKRWDEVSNVLAGGK